MSYARTILLFMELAEIKQPAKWYCIKEVSSEINLSIDRTRKHLTKLVLAGLLDTKINKWHNVYRFRR